MVPLFELGLCLRNPFGREKPFAAAAILEVIYKSEQALIIPLVVLLGLGKWWPEVYARYWFNHIDVEVFDAACVVVRVSKAEHNTAAGHIANPPTSTLFEQMSNCGPIIAADFIWIDNMTEWDNKPHLLRIFPPKLILK